MNCSRIRFLIVFLAGLSVFGEVDLIYAQSKGRISTGVHNKNSQSNELQQNITHDSDGCSAFIDCDSANIQQHVSHIGLGYGYNGMSVSIDGDWVIVGSSWNGVSRSRAGIYKYNGTALEYYQSITPQYLHRYVEFGYSVSVSGNVAVVGAVDDHDLPNYSIGAAYLYRFDGVRWIDEQKLLASDAKPYDKFGWSVAIDGDIAVVGANHDDCDVGLDCGSAYVYRYDGSSWIEEQHLFDPNPLGFSLFGNSVAISNDVIVIGAPRKGCTNGSYCGSVFIYRYNGSLWIEEQILTESPSKAYEWFGHTVSISDDVIVVGTVLDDCADGLNCGAAYIYRYNGSTWMQEQKLTEIDASEGDKFGNSVSVHGNAIVVGASKDDCNIGINCGAAYVYRFNGTKWVEAQKIVDINPVRNGEYGHTVSTNGDLAVVTAFPECGYGNCGDLYFVKITDDDCNCDDIADICEADTDEDSIIECDVCPDSIMDETIVIDGCDSGVTNTLFDDGCTMADVLSECISDSRSRGRDVSCVTEVARRWLRDRLITGREYSRIVSCAASTNSQRTNGNTNSSSLRQRR